MKAILENLCTLLCISLPGVAMLLTTIGKECSNSSLLAIGTYMLVAIGATVVIVITTVLLEALLAPEE